MRVMPKPTFKFSHALLWGDATCCMACKSGWQFEKQYLALRVFFSPAQVGPAFISHARTSCNLPETSCAAPPCYDF